MDLPFVAMPVCEICDRLTIVMLKIERLPDDAADKALLRRQEAYYKRGVDQSNVQITNLLHKLLWCNGKIWDLEHELRKGMDDNLGYDEIGRRAVAIRDMNRMRVQYKNAIAELTGQPEFTDCKMNHLSQ